MDQNAPGIVAAAHVVETESSLGVRECAAHGTFRPLCAGDVVQSSDAVVSNPVAAIRSEFSDRDGHLSYL
jgi:hypothetical protein